MDLGIFDNIFLIIFAVVITGTAFLRPIFGFFLLVLIIPLESVVVLPGGITWVRLMLMFTLFAWITRKIIISESWHEMLSTNLLVKVLLFFTFILMSFLWSHYPGRILVSLLTFSALLTLCLFMIDVSTNWERVEMAMRLLIIGGTVAATMTIVQYFVMDYLRAGGRISGGINRTSLMLVVLQPVAFFIFRSSRSSFPWRLLSLAYIVLSPLAVALTFSRISYAIMPFVYIRQLFAKKIERLRELVVIVILGFIIISAAFFLIPWQAVELRLDSLTPILDGQVESEESLANASERIHIWKCAIEIFKDNSILGVGYKNFGYHFKNYQYRVTGMRKITNKENRSPHSTILGTLAELGIVGILLWFSLQYTVFKNFRTSLAACDSQNGQSKELMIRAIQQVFYIFMAYSLVSNIHHTKLFWLVLGMNGAFVRLSKSSDNKDD